MKKILTKKGFTLIELIVVIAILAILAAILIPSLTDYLARAEAAKDEANARSLYSELMLGWASNSTTNPYTNPAEADIPDNCKVTGTSVETVVVTCGASTFPEGATPLPLS